MARAKEIAFLNGRINQLNSELEAKRGYRGAKAAILGVSSISVAAVLQIKSWSRGCPAKISLIPKTFLALACALQRVLSGEIR